MPNLEKNIFFFLFVTEGGVAAPQDVGPTYKPIAYPSKGLDQTTTGWPPCLQVVVATALLVTEATELTEGKRMTVFTPHRVVSVLQAKGDHWTTGGHIIKTLIVPFSWTRQK